MNRMFLIILIIVGSSLEIFAQHFSKSTDEILIKHKYYETVFSKKWHIPLWTHYTYTKKLCDGATLELKTPAFKADPQLPNEDYKDDYAGSGFDQGHMVPREDMTFNETAMKETYYFTNCVPQYHAVNGGVWRSLEKLVRRWAQEHTKIEVYTGAFIHGKPKLIGEHELAVPDSTFKVIYDVTSKEKTAIAFMIPNINHTVSGPQCWVRTVDHIEKLTGRDFFPELSNAIENRIEKMVDMKRWSWDKECEE